MNIVVILGLYLNDDGSMKEELVKRVELGVKTFKETNADLLVLTGGIANKNAGIAEARAMSKLVYEKRIDKEKVIIEDKSRTTVENAKNTKAIFSNQKVDTIYVVSTKYHFFRHFAPKANKVFIKAFPNSKVISVYEDE